MLQRYPVMVIGVEFLPQMLAAAQRRLQFAGKSGLAHLVRTNAAWLPFPERSFDRAYSESVIGFQEVGIVVQMLGEIQRVLKPGGVYVANEAIWKPNLDSQVVAQINYSCEADFGLRQSTDQPWSIAHWLDAAQAAGFRLHSADLLEVHLKVVEDGGAQSAARYTGTSRLFTWIYRQRSLLDRRSLQQHLRYRRLLQKHRQDGAYLEERLFILEKP
jgi:SAM-dependent methyltransferase